MSCQLVHMTDGRSSPVERTIPRFQQKPFFRDLTIEELVLAFRPPSRRARCPNRACWVLSGSFRLSDSLPLGFRLGPRRILTVTTPYPPRILPVTTPYIHFEYTVWSRGGYGEDTVWSGRREGVERLGLRRLG